MLVKLSFELCMNYNNSKVFWQTLIAIIWERKLYSRNYAWTTMSLYKSGSSNLPQELCHSKINLAIKECLLLNIKIQQNKWSGLSPSCLHIESLVTSDFPHRYPVHTREWRRYKACDAAGIQGLRQVRSRGTETALLHFPVCVSALQDRAEPAACSPQTVLGMNHTRLHQKRSRLLTAEHGPGSVLSSCTAHQGCWISNRLVSGTDPGRCRHTAGAKSVSALPSTAHARSRWQDMDRAPCARNSLQGKQESLMQLNYIEATSTAQTAWSKLSLLLTCIL